MHRLTLNIILLASVALAAWGCGDLATAFSNSPGSVLPMAGDPPPDTIDKIVTLAWTARAYLGGAKIVSAVIVAVLCIGFDGLLAVAHEMRRRHPGNPPPSLLARVWNRMTGDPQPGEDDIDGE